QFAALSEACGVKAFAMSNPSGSSRRSHGLPVATRRYICCRLHGSSPPRPCRCGRCCVAAAHLAHARHRSSGPLSLARPWPLRGFHHLSERTPSKTETASPDSPSLQSLFADLSSIEFDSASDFQRYIVKLRNACKVLAVELEFASDDLE